VLVVIWTFVAAVTAVGLVVWITAVNFCYLLVQIAIASGNSGVAEALRAVARFIRAEFRYLGTIFLVVLAMVVAATLASALVVAGHAATFLIAAHAAGATAPLSQLLPLALIVLLGAALPNIGGWGPREGVTAWAFAAAGLGASLGVTTAVAYGVMVFVASLPGAVFLVLHLDLDRELATLGALHVEDTSGTSDLECLELGGTGDRSLTDDGVRPTLGIRDL
jgi:hypothetical protein